MTAISASGGGPVKTNCLLGHAWQIFNVFSQWDSGVIIKVTVVTTVQLADWRRPAVPVPRFAPSEDDEQAVTGAARGDSPSLSTVTAVQARQAVHTPGL